MRQLLQSKPEQFSLNYSSRSVGFKMASTSDGGHGGKLINSGRKRIIEKLLKLKRIFEGYLK